jgi:hypothetical protein
MRSYQLNQVGVGILTLNTWVKSANERIVAMEAVAIRFIHPGISKIESEPINSKKAATKKPARGSKKIYNAIVKTI